MGAVANLYIDQGSTFSTSVFVKNDDETAFDLESHTAAGQIRKSYSSSTKVDFALEIADPTSLGQINASLTATQTGSLEEGRYVYDIEVTSSTGTVTRVLEGIITVNPQVTK
jgi:hypothetical protein